jgi:atypical dual specificity phosphatase
MNLNFSWIVEDRLAGSSGPRSIGDLVSLRKQGIEALVRLVEPDEAWLTVKEINDVGLEDCDEPVRDFTAPTQAQIDKIITYIDSHLERGVPVGVSCNAGIGRTGVILACYLVHKGFTAKDAIELVREKRGRMPEIPEQTVAIEEYWLRIRSGMPPREPRERGARK